jgi:hypothetical protein
MGGTKYFYIYIYQQRNYNKEQQRVGQPNKKSQNNIISVSKQKIKGIYQINDTASPINSLHEYQEN